jgi:hypothetical protein
MKMSDLPIPSVPHTVPDTHSNNNNYQDNNNNSYYHNAQIMINARVRDTTKRTYQSKLKIMREWLFNNNYNNYVNTGIFISCMYYIYHVDSYM